MVRKKTVEICVDKYEKSAWVIDEPLGTNICFDIEIFRVGKNREGVAAISKSEATYFFSRLGFKRVSKWKENCRGWVANFELI